jgi:hypothetical protein
MAHRTFSGSDGALWNAWSIAPDRPESWNTKAAHFLPTGMTEGWLCFECGDDKRRLSPVPDGWDALSDEELRAMCASANPVVRRGASPNALAEPPRMAGPG